MVAPKHYGELATEQQVEESKQAAQSGMVSSLEFAQYKQELQVAITEIIKILNDSADRLNGRT